MGLFGSGRRTVVGSVILGHGGNKFLAAERSYPPALAGQWELPGGKSDPGEKPRDTIQRELMEELGIRVTVLRKLSGQQNIGTDLRLQVWVVQLTGGTPRLIEGHRSVRWLDADTLWSVKWLKSNVKFVEQIPRHLGK